VRILDSRRQADGELSDSDDEGDGGRRDHASYQRDDHKFGIGGGILNAGATHGIGPSGNTHARARLLAARGDDMEVDEQQEAPGDSAMRSTGGGEEEPATKASTPVPDEIMAVDPSTVSP